MSANLFIWVLTLSVGAFGFLCTVGALCLASDFSHRFVEWIRFQKEAAELRRYWRKKR